MVETMLYAFASPYIWFIRKDVSESFSSSEKVAEVPPFLIIGGNAGTGKTKLLLFINKLLGNKQDIYDSTRFLSLLTKYHKTCLEAVVKN